MYLEYLDSNKCGVDIPGEGSVNGLSNGFLVPDPLLLGLQQPLPTQVFPMVLSSSLSRQASQHSQSLYKYGTQLKLTTGRAQLSQALSTGWRARKS